MKKWLYNLGYQFEAVVDKVPNNTALKLCPDQDISYQTLNQNANQAARFLLERGIQTKDVVCLVGEKTVNTFAFIIGCLKIGATYCILDPESPLVRIEKIINTCRPKAILGGADFFDMFTEVTPSNSYIAIVDNDELVTDLKALEEINLSQTCNVTADNPAYIMFTSGSTGVPKGALMTHQNVLNLIAWSLDTFQITNDDILTNVNPLYFDNSVFDIYSSLFTGACLASFPKSVVTDPLGLVEKIDEFGCTSWFSTPSLLIYLLTVKVLNPGNMRSIKRYIFGGEGFPKAKLKSLYDMYADRAQLFNVYGPTECTCICSVYPITSADFQDLQGFPPLGQIAKNFSYQIVTEDQQPVKEGESGELWLLGPHVGKGYYNDPKRTDQSFSQNPYSLYPDRAYKTGDLVRWDPSDSKLYFVGRADNQIKHMGYRIELEEIETAINALDYTAECAVIHGTRRGISQILAVVSFRTGEDVELLAQDLKKVLPAYMLPKKILIENPLPKNQNGKIDRNFLKTKYFH